MILAKLTPLPPDVIDPQVLVPGAVGFMFVLAAVEVGVYFMRRAVRAEDSPSSDG